MTPFNFAVSQKLDWFGTVRGRIGITPWSQNALIYVTSGLIYGEEDVSSSIAIPAVGETFAANESSTRTGGVIGGGLEYRFTSALSGKMTGVSANGFIGSTTYHFEGGIVRAGLNYQFTWGAGPAVATRY